MERRVSPKERYRGALEWARVCRQDGRIEQAKELLFLAADIRRENMYAPGHFRTPAPVMPRWVTEGR